ncbi:hypothetical protein QUW63_11410 [Pseudoflavonifractor phocaeensis]|uniref:hypothetical protein n=1 Tax=Pseudoflavonifractor phocaeensis TaxID=1870988 RepID=UPI0025A34F83|nr:hypothetical protein [Pseudoflavonifractor phocaeensis]MDM8239697.1 hypothetical protein [Pseudoflavonifractor phocaeensis]
MKYYNQYMDSQQVSPDFHRTLCELQPRPRRSHVRQVAALTACGAAACLALYVGLSPASAPNQVASDAIVPGIQDTIGPGESSGYLVPNSGQGTTNFFCMGGLDYVPWETEVDGSLRYDVQEGSFGRTLTQEQLFDVFWPDGDGEGIPWTLFWDGYTLKADAIYDKEGSLLWVTVVGSKGDAHFSLQLSPDQLPPTCVAGPEPTYYDYFGTEIAAWTSTGDWNDDGESETKVTIQAVKDGIGVRFVNYGQTNQDGADTALDFNSFFVNRTFAGEGIQLTLDHLLTTTDIPDWRANTFSSLEEARQETAFAPYLPASAPTGYGEFEGKLSYQEGVRNTLFLRWSRGYSDVTVRVSLPEGGAPEEEPVDVNTPAAYDVRLYSIPWCDSVPEEYRNSVSSPTFRAQDMTREIIAARSLSYPDAGDIDGPRINFTIRYSDGTEAEYTSKGLREDALWAMISPTLPG